MSVALTTLLLFSGLLLLIFAGVPLAFAVGSIAVVFGVLEWGPESVHLLFGHVQSSTFNYTLASIPFFMLMASFLGKSGIAEDIYALIHVLFGRLRGGLAVGTVLGCAVIASMTGVSALGVVAMGTLALPVMLAKGYDARLSMGTIMAGGGLGQLFPPSLLGIVYSGLANVSVGKIFLAGVGPGFLLVILFCVYCLVRCALNPSMGPAAPAGEHEKVGAREVVALFVRVIPCFILIGLVLGSLFLGIASPTESAGLGATGALIIAVLRGRMGASDLRKALLETVKSTSMILWLALSSLMLVSVYSGTGGDDFVRSLLVGQDLQPWMVVALMMLIIFFLGLIMDPVGIIFLTTPIFLPVILQIGYDPLWYGGLLILNLEMAYITPPFGYNLFYMKSVAPPEITMKEIYRSTPPFVLLQAFALVLCAALPELVTWLPNHMLGE
ncbi:TRAP transporter large permease [Variovorax sp. LT1P1]|uniref:TRAP transporter large permease n=1 Tax=Variovorax sp. LT1P1 TaxID=3443730 RepID=UPI003F490075